MGMPAVAGRGLAGRRGAAGLGSGGSRSIRGAVTKMPQMYLDIKGSGSRNKHVFPNSQRKCMPSASAYKLDE